jgi:Phage capsid family
VIDDQENRGKKARAEKRSIASQVVDLARNNYELGVSDDGIPFGSRPDVPHVAMPLRGGKFGLRAELGHRHSPAEGAEITATDATLDELTITPSKLAALSVISSELANDSTPEAAQAVGDSIVRDLSRKVDQALFTATTTNGPGGLPGVSGVTSVSGPATDYANVDPFSDAVYSSAAANGTITAWVTNPATAKN